MPEAMERPCASEPVVTSMPGLCSAPIISTEAAVLVEQIERLLVHAAGLDQRRIDHQSIMGRRDDEAIVIRAGRAVIASAGEGIRIVRRGHAQRAAGTLGRVGSPSVSKSL